MKSAASTTTSSESRRRLRWSPEVLNVCQIVASFLIVIAALLNLSLSDRDKALWSTLVGGGFGYLVPNPMLRRPRIAMPFSKDESVYHVTAECSMDVYPNNAAAEFTTKLSEVVELEGRWEVGLLET